tara:strand:+ start:13 stop:483 length:471 start_codon:yes stop_codon:yes gene_type:complete
VEIKTPPVENELDPAEGIMYNPPRELERNYRMENKTKVDVYWNINKKCFSIKDCKTGKVTGYTDAIRLVKAQFIVRKAGRDRVIREQQKNVHAFVRGYIEDVVSKATTTSEIREATYNPYKYDSFVDKHTEQPISEASVVELFTTEDIKGDIKWAV